MKMFVLFIFFNWEMQSFTYYSQNCSKNILILNISILKPLNTVYPDSICKLRSASPVGYVIDNLDVIMWLNCSTLPLEISDILITFFLIITYRWFIFW